MEVNPTRTQAEKWQYLVEWLSTKFSQGEDLNIEGILYLIGVQEFGIFERKFTKDDKLNLIHIGICEVFSPLGYYEFEHYDEQGWPHYKLKEKIPFLKGGEQTVLLKQAILGYFDSKQVDY